MTAKDIFVNSFVITVSDLYMNRISNLFSAHGIPVPRAYAGQELIWLDRNENIMLSHVEIIKMAKTMCWPSVTVFEEDAVPRSDAYKVIDGMLQDLPADAECAIYGDVGKSVDCTPGWHAVSGNDYSFGSHAYTLFSSGYDKYLRYFRTHQNIHADWFWGCGRNVVKAYVSGEPLFVQHNISMSSNGMMNWAYSTMKLGVEKPSYEQHMLPPPGFSI